MESVTAKEIARKWGVSNRRVNTLCNSGRITGAYKNNYMWMIPKNAKKPIDLRKKKYSVDNNKINQIYIEQEKYQKNISEDIKKQNGIYYTPSNIVNLMYNELKSELDEDSVILDPCCGMGSFLVGALDYGFMNIHGVDNDSEAIETLSKHIKSINAVQFDSINNPSEELLLKLGIQKPDLIIGNPPYATGNSAFRNLFVGSIVRSLDAVKEYGYISFIIPKNFLHVSMYKELRKNILNNYQIVSIIDLGSYFKNVRGEQIILTLKNQRPVNSHQLTVKTLENKQFKKKIKINQNFFEDTIKLFTSEKEKAIYQKLTYTNTTLGEYCNGNIKRGKSKSNQAISGKDIEKFRFKNHQIPVTGNQIFIQNIYSSESGIIAAFGGDLEAKETVTIIQDTSLKVSKFLIGLLHSKLINFYLFKYSFNGSKLTLHTDKQYLSPIPIVFPNNQQIEKIVEYVECLEISKYRSEQWFNLYEGLNNIIYDLYQLSDEEQTYIENQLCQIQSQRWNNEYR